MIEKLVQSLHESVKKRNNPEAYIIDKPSDAEIIHRGYVRDATFPLKYDFLPKSKGKSKNEGTHVYHFKADDGTGIIEIDHRVNGSIASGHETTSTISHELNGVETDVNLRRTLLPAVQHHIRSHDPDVLKIKKGFKFTKELIDRIDPDGNIFNISKTDFGTILKKKAPIDEKSKRIISHLKKKMSINKNKEN